MARKRGAKPKTVDRLRRARMDMPLDEELAGTDDFLLEETVKKEQARQLREAVALLSEPDREIIRRFYDLCQTAPEIAAVLGLTPSACVCGWYAAGKPSKTSYAGEGLYMNNIDMILQSADLPESPVDAISDERRPKS